jgi:hypothetical protein
MGRRRERPLEEFRSWLDLVDGVVGAAGEMSSETVVRWGTVMRALTLRISAELDQEGVVNPDVVISCLKALAHLDWPYADHYDLLVRRFATVSGIFAAKLNELAENRPVHQDFVFRALKGLDLSAEPFSAREKIYQVFRGCRAAPLGTGQLIGCVAKQIPD